MDRNPHPTAIVALSDMATLSVLFCLAERKVEVGVGMSVVGFDDYPWMLARRTPITAVSQPVPEIALSIWQRLQLRMEGDQSPPKAIELECSLKIRDSANPIERRPRTQTAQPEFPEKVNSEATTDTVRNPIH
jgi:LacI family transcriptional regulator